MPVTIFGVPVLFHWSFPALAATGGLFAVACAGELRIAVPVFLSASMAYLFLVLAHEFGHAAIARLAGLRVERIIIAGTAGWCFVSPSKSDVINLLVYSGGILAQVALLTVTCIALLFLGPPSHLPVTCIVFVFTFVNVIGILWNAIPIQGRNDGALITSTIRRIRGPGR